MKQIQDFLTELAYHDTAEATFIVKGIKLYVTIKNMSLTPAQRLMKKYFPDARVSSLEKKDSTFVIF